jgi:DNA (cytosine-5)-methyltransferase 1
LNKQIKFIDLFAGIGGFRIAMENLNCKCVFASEIDRWACKTYEANFGEVPSGNIREISANEIPDFDILCGGFPCQPFSSASENPRGFDDVRGTLFFEIARILSEKKPQAFLIENVKNLLYHDHKKTFKVILKVLEKDLNYKVFFKLINSKDYGVAQKRERVYIIGFRNDIKCDTFNLNKQKYPKVKIKDILENNIPTKLWYSQKGIDGLERHKARHSVKGDGLGYRLNSLDGQSFTIVSGRWGRKNNLIIDTNLDELERTTNKKNDRFIRRFTARELARLQGFPENFIIPVSHEHAHSQFGNSVAVPVIKAIASDILKILEKNKTEGLT